MFVVRTAVVDMSGTTVVVVASWDTGTPPSNPLTLMASKPVRRLDQTLPHPDLFKHLSCLSPPHLIRSHGFLSTYHLSPLT